MSFDFMCKTGKNWTVFDWNFFPWMLTQVFRISRKINSVLTVWCTWSLFLCVVRAIVNCCCCCSKWRDTHFTYIFVSRSNTRKKSMNFLLLFTTEDLFAHTAHTHTHHSVCIWDMNENVYSTPIKHYYKHTHTSIRITHSCVFDVGRHEERMRVYILLIKMSQRLIFHEKVGHFIEKSCKNGRTTTNDHFSPSFSGEGFKFYWKIIHV